MQLYFELFPIGSLETNQDFPSCGVAMWSTSSELVLTKIPSSVWPDGEHRGDDDSGDQRRQQRVLDRRRAGVVRQEAPCSPAQCGHAVLRSHRCAGQGGKNTLTTRHRRPVAALHFQRSRSKDGYHLVFTELTRVFFGAARPPAAGRASPAARRFAVAVAGRAAACATAGARLGLQRDDLRPPAHPGAALARRRRRRLAPRARPPPPSAARRRGRRGSGRTAPGRSPARAGVCE